MYRNTKNERGERASLKLAMQGYAVAAVVSTTGWDALLLITFLLLGILTLRGVLGRVAALL